MANSSAILETYARQNNIDFHWDAPNLIFTLSFQSMGRTALDDLFTLKELDQTPRNLVYKDGRYLVRYPCKG